MVRPVRKVSLSGIEAPDTAHYSLNVTFADSAYKETKGAIQQIQVVLKSEGFALQANRPSKRMGPIAYWLKGNLINCQVSIYECDCEISIGMYAHWRTASAGRVIE